jgi:homoserine/homoserine lactone efflux protein
VLSFVKFASAIYLIVTGLLMIYTSYRNTHAISINLKEVKYSKAFYQGMIAEFSNPKAVIFFMAILPQFITQGKNIPLQFIVLGITSLAIEFIVLMLYGFMASNSKKLVKENSKFTKTKDRIAGVALIGVGVKLCL